MFSQLVLVPTRELAVQVHHALSTCAASTPLRLTAIFGGVAMNGQVDALRRGVDIVVATPGRLLDHLQRRTAVFRQSTCSRWTRRIGCSIWASCPALRRIVTTLPRRRQSPPVDPA
jgi:ATP-dependent RNA helicase RhlE